ncbi:MAG TPA: 30S ribosomal protein S18 [Candidatus Paceibacterota bacterium]|jgi:small subunit ribosomal protein S18|nr:30S ribosomal protein S18 [Candidatus Paceibacterota bacterium]HRZ29414.1 30S ribosomal protein S18 [Candidatus Paceibacterota bacterium]
MKLIKPCYFCQKGIVNLDYKDIDTLKKFISSQYKILPRRKTNTCAKHQRALCTAIKRARVMALLPFCPNNKK